MRIRPARIGGAYEALVYVFLALPTVVVVGASLNTAELLAFPPRGLTLHWYAVAFKNTRVHESLWISLQLAIIATVLSLMWRAGRLRASPLSNSAARRAALADSALAAGGAGRRAGDRAAAAFVVLGLARTFTGLMIGQSLITLPYVVRNMTAAFVLFDPALEQAARNLRASTFQVIRRVTCR